MTLVDTNVLLDVATADSRWGEWAVEALDRAALNGPLLTNDVIYAELSTRYDRIEMLDEFIAAAGLQWAEMPRASLFLAAKAFRKYRLSGGSKTGVLPDFFIGAQAAVLDAPLLTRDVGRYRTYFPTIRLIAPEVS